MSWQNPTADTAEIAGGSIETGEVSHPARRSWSFWPRALGGEFFRLWAASGLSMLAGQIARVALYLYVFEETGSVLTLSSLAILEILPAVLLAPFGGLLADTMDQRLLLVGTNSFRLLCLLGMALNPSPAAIRVLVFLHAFGGVLFEPVKNACVPLTVPPSELDSANSADQAAGQAIMVVGPLIGTGLAVRFGMVTAMVGAMVLYGGSLALLAGVGQLSRRVRAIPGRQPVPVPDGLGLRYLAGHEVPRTLVMLSSVSLLATGLWWPLAPFFVRDSLGSPAGLVGIQAGVFGVGGLLGAALAPSLSCRLGRGVLVLGALAGEGLVMLLYSRCSDPGTSTGLCLLWGIVVSLILVPYYSIMQQVVDLEALGRVFSLAKQAEGLAVLLSLAVAASLHDRLGAAGLFGLFALAYFLGIATFIATPRSRVILKIG